VAGRCAAVAVGDWARLPAGHDNRRYFEGRLWIARTVSQWRQLPAKYGLWNSVNQRFGRWALTGIWYALLQTLSELAKPERRRHMIERTIVRAHQNAAGGKRGNQNAEPQPRRF